MIDIVKLIEDYPSTGNILIDTLRGVSGWHYSDETSFAAADEIIRLRAANEKLQAEVEKLKAHRIILSDALSEIKSTNDGHSTQPIKDIIEWCLEEVKALKGASD